MSNICSNLILTRTNVFGKVYLESGDKNAKSNKKIWSSNYVLHNFNWWYIIIEYAFETY